MAEELFEEDIDQIVEIQAADDAAWEDPIYVSKSIPVPLSIPADLAARAAFLARLHRETDLAEWITHIVKERVELEEAAFTRIKRDLAAKQSHPSGG